MYAKFYFEDNTSKTFDMDKRIRGLRGLNGDRPVLVIVVGSKDEVTETVKNNYYATVLPSLCPLRSVSIVRGSAQEVLV